ncbi:protein transport protein SEC61 subunit beta, putative [Plasmodium vivax]|uniref:Protein transport protein SEC61 subunit beta, putative n=1 Tax=Plasmodium vivax TaxID=5855 RepID=A0A564ZRY1_PLAVI|nr:protein transport protein SEC61 subunit beta, putative [Plasmodium vivax]
MNSSPVIVGGMRTPARRRQSTASASSNSKPRGSNSGNTNSIVKFYGDDSPGFKLLPSDTQQLLAKFKKKKKKKARMYVHTYVHTYSRMGVHMNVRRKTFLFPSPWADLGGTLPVHIYNAKM